MLQMIAVYLLLSAVCCCALSSSVSTFACEEQGVSLEETIATHLRRRGWHLALVETTTGGLMAARLVRLPGSSAYFDRSIVAYSKEAKIQSLGVDASVFERNGSVSPETANAMAEGLRRLSQADMVLAETGIAGPIRGRSPKPPGTTCFALLTPTGNYAEEIRFMGDRQAIQEQIAGFGLGMIARYLTSTALGE
jgi:PncC family amidohydrolase